ALSLIPDLPTPDFTAHALLAATRADLVEHLAGTEGVPREQLRAQLAEFTARVLAPTVRGD
ncbi:TetR/AcrR family transcriptional regulator, partial [Streptomyces sp. SID8455]|nr:TetR/AcrR family transcriptional regulator [Streptomyces sp. SID8455]